MTNVLIRDVPADDLEQIRATAAAQGTSVQAYLRDVMQAQAGYLRRQEALAAISERLADGAAMPDTARGAVLDDIDAAHDERSSQLSERSS